MKLIHDDCLSALKNLEDNYIDSIITDPPYGLEFLNKKWDYDVPSIEIWQEALRVAKPGALLLCFAGSRTFHRMAVRIEDAGWQMRDTIMWIYGSGFPKSHDVGINVDKQVANAPHRGKMVTHHNGAAADKPQSMPRYEALSEEGKLWTGWKTALKPAYEPILIFQKPTDGTYAENALKHGVAGFNIDQCRIGNEKISVHNAPVGTFAGGELDRGSETDYRYHEGRYPANVIFDEEAGAELDRQSGNLKGGASRFFYCPKSSKREKNAGLLDRTPDTVHDGHTKTDTPYQRPFTLRHNIHPTIKPLELMKYLCRLTKTPTGGTVLDPFMGSGSTGIAAILEGRDFVGIEREEEYIEIARKRIEHWTKYHDLLEF